MDYKKVLYVSQELTPYMPTTPMAELSRMLPQAIQEKGNEVRTFMPKYGSIKERRNQLHEVIRLSGLNIVIDDADHPLIIKVATLQPTRMQVYFIDNEDYFARTAQPDDIELYTDPAHNDERMMFFARGVVETVKKLRWDANIIHCSGWMSALAPMYFKSIYGDCPGFEQSKTVYSVFGSSLPQPLEPRFAEKLRADGFTPEQTAPLGDTPADTDTVHRLAIDHSDAVVLASDNISEALIEYIKSTGKPFLPYPGDDNYMTACAEFYASL